MSNVIDSKASLTLMLSLALVSKKCILYCVARALPSSSETCLSSAMSHLLPMSTLLVDSLACSSMIFTQSPIRWKDSLLVRSNRSRTPWAPRK